MGCYHCKSHGTNLATINVRKNICAKCPQRKSEVCLVDNKSVKKKFFTGECPENRWPKVKVKKRKAPPLINQIKSFGRSMTKWAVSGFQKTSNKVYNQRLEICKGCEFWDKEAFMHTGRCLKCGCSTKAKLRLKTEKCPIGKW